ncbi:MAG: cytochrome BD quinol oxidase subunit I [Phycisphaera sp.]|nr:cytochrome BD quinol oxidase subunit I [Phycisphaera sp.]
MVEPSVFYPVNDFGPAMKGLVIGGLGIFHVFLAQFAIGGGMLMAYYQWLAMRGKLPEARQVLDSYFRYLVLVSFVIGALTGVGMWFTSIQISPATIGKMVDTFHWVWATEWIFFWVEVVAGYAFYRYGKILSDRARLTLLLIYSVAGFGSLFWINGILSWQLTPGEWVETGNIWAGFFNATFWPSLFYRTAAAMVIAGLVAAVVVNTMSDVTREQRTALINATARFMLGVVAMPVLGIWFLLAMPADSREWVLGGSIAMTLFLNAAVGASVLIGGYAVVGLWRQKLYINGATATLLLALAFGATAGGEFVREGVRKPYTIRDVLFSNAVTPGQVAHLREVGCTTDDPFPLRDADRYANDQLRTGALVFRSQCAVCHTVSGVNGLTHLMGAWSVDQQRMNVAKLQLTKGFMPPFAGTPAELEALVQFVRWEAADHPTAWAESGDAATFAEIKEWLDEAGTEPAPIARRDRSSNGGAE